MRRTFTKTALGRCACIGFLGALALTARAGGETVSITDFGVVPDSGADAVPAVRKALEQCATDAYAVLEFPQGRYDFFPQEAPRREYFESNSTDENPKVCPILIEGMTNLTIDGKGSTFVFHGQEQPFTVDHSTNVTLSNLSIDWDVTLTAQAEVVAVDSRYFDLRINTKESPYVIEDDQLVFVTEDRKSAWWGVMEFDRETHLIPPGTGDQTLGGVGRYRAEELEPGLVRIHKRTRVRPRVGNFLVLRHNPRIHAGVFLTESKDVTLRNVNVYHTGGLGILAQYTENVTLDHVNVVPNAAKGRYFSGHDDGAHISNCRGLIRMEHCAFAGLMDDPVNVHGTSVPIVEKVDAKTLRCRFMHEQSVGLPWGRAGETVGFIENESMETVGRGTVATFTKLSVTGFELTFADAVPEAIGEGDALENLTWAPDVELRDNRFGNCRARGVLISTPGKVVIENNTFESSGSAILIAGDANQWYESGAVRDVLIRGNVFEEACLTNRYQFCEAIISICPEVPEPARASKPFHRNIRIENNIFHPFDYPVLYAFSAEGLTFENNTLIRSNRYAPYHANQHTVKLVHCRAVTIAGNVLKGDVLGRDIYVEDMDPSEVTTPEGQPAFVGP